MRINRGNRKLAALAMTLAALVGCFVFACWLKPDSTMFGTVVTGIALASGATVWGNVQTHRTQSKDGEDQTPK